MSQIELATLGELYTPGEVADRIKIKPATLGNWRRQSKNSKAVGPRFLMVGGVVRYPESWLSEWLREQNVEYVGRVAEAISEAIRSEAKERPTAPPRKPATKKEAA